MSFAVTDSHSLIADTVDRLLTASDGNSSRWQLFATQGVIASLVPEEFGGIGGSVRDLAILMDLMGHRAAGEPILATAVSTSILKTATDREFVQTQLDAMNEGRRVVVLAHTEGATPFAAPATRAAHTPGGIVLSGQKIAVRHADTANAFLVSARLNDATALFLVERDASKTCRRLRLIDGSYAANIEFENSPARLLLDGFNAERALAEAINWWLAGLAAETCGILRRLNAATQEYLRTRKQFGAPLAALQALQHRIADMHIATEHAHAVTGRAVYSIEQGVAERSAIASAAKAVSDDAGRKVGHDAVQLHGGMGVSDELDISRSMRRLAAIRAEAGEAEIHRSRFGVVSWSELADAF